MTLNDDLVRIIIENSLIKDKIPLELLEIEKEFDSASKQENSKEIKRLIDKALLLIGIGNNDGAIYYDIGNAYGELDAINNGRIENGYADKRLHYYRKSIDYYEKNKDSCDDLALLTLYTNYANVLRDTQRPFSAFRYYRKALEISDFDMAKGNYACCLHLIAIYANQKYGSNVNIDRHAYNDLCELMNSNDCQVLASGAKIYWQSVIDDIEKNKEYFDIVLNANLSYLENKYDINDNKNWCIVNHLFLNVESEINEHNGAYAFDHLYVPDLNGENQLMFNQLCDDYCYCRYYIYEITKCPNDTPIQTIESFYNLLYSIFDRIAYFINIYYKLGKNKEHIYASKLLTSQDFFALFKENHILSGLYFTYKEFNEKYGNGSKEDTPYKDLLDLRNGFQHRYVFINNDLKGNATKTENMNYEVSQVRLMEYTYDLLLIVREAIMILYMSLINEYMKNNYNIHK